MCVIYAQDHIYTLDPWIDNIRTLPQKKIIRFLNV